MSGNRFEFLEIGETQPAPVLPPTPAEPVPAEPGATGRGPDGTTLAQVRVTDPRGYGPFLQMQEESEVVSPAARRSDIHFPTGTLRAVEVFGERGVKAAQFNFPTGLAADATGIVFVADSYNHRLQRVTPSGGVSIIGERGVGRGQFLSPQAVAVDDQRAFYIVEQGNHRVQKYSADGVLQLLFGRHGRGAGDLHGPMGIAVAPGTGDIYVADTGNCRVQRFDSAGHFVASIGARGGMAVPLSSPQALAIDAGDNLFIADTLAHRIARFDPLGRFVGQYTGDFREPRALAVDNAGLIYVADSGGAGGAGLERPGRIQAIETETGKVRGTVEKPGRGLGGMERPSGLAVGPGVQAASGIGAVVKRDIYVSDTMNHRILRFAWG